MTGRNHALLQPSAAVSTIVVASAKNTQSWRNTRVAAPAPVRLPGSALPRPDRPAVTGWSGASGARFDTGRFRGGAMVQVGRSWGGAIERDVADAPVDPPGVYLLGQAAAPTGADEQLVMPCLASYTGAATKGGPVRDQRLTASPSVETLTATDSTGDPLSATLEMIADRLFDQARRLRRAANVASWRDLAARASSVGEAPAGVAAPVSVEFGQLQARLDAAATLVSELDGAIDGLLRDLTQRGGRDLVESDEPLYPRGATTTRDLRPKKQRVDEIIWVQEEERHRLAREIHDGPAQVLSNAVMELEFCQRLLDRNPDRLRQEIAKLKANLRLGLADVRSFLFDLRPPALQDLGLAATLGRLAEEYQNRFNIAVVLEIADLEAERLSPAIEVTLFRIVQEALQNVQRHAGTDQVTLRCQRTPGSLRVEIADAGRGFDPAQLPEKHLGLVSMRERAQLIGGQLTICSQPGQGTCISLVLPIEPGEGMATTTGYRPRTRGAGTGRTE